jgi:hypothetical protein
LKKIADCTVIQQTTKNKHKFTKNCCNIENSRLHGHTARY